MCFISLCIRKAIGFFDTEYWYTKTGALFSLKNENIFKKNEGILSHMRYNPEKTWRELQFGRTVLLCYYTISPEIIYLKKKQFVIQRLHL